MAHAIIIHLLTDQDLLVQLAQMVLPTEQMEVAPMEMEPQTEGQQRKRPIVQLLTNWKLCKEM